MSSDLKWHIFVQKGQLDRLISLCVNTCSPSFLVAAFLLNLRLGRTPCKILTVCMLVFHSFIRNI